MTRRLAYILSAGLALAACAHSAQTHKDAAMSTASSPSKIHLQPVKEWPLRFESHGFGARCYDTQACSVRYGSLEYGDDDPSPPASAPGYLDNWNSLEGMIRNFPAPAKVAWKSKDGEAHKAEIDIGALFRDELIRHNVRREDMADLPNGEYSHEPYILLEVNDRTIRVYMKAWIPLKREIEIAGHMRNDVKEELILVKAYTY